METTIVYWGYIGVILGYWGDIGVKYGYVVVVGDISMPTTTACDLTSGGF